MPDIDALTDSLAQAQAQSRASISRGGGGERDVGGHHHYASPSAPSGAFSEASASSASTSASASASTTGPLAAAATTNAALQQQRHDSARPPAPSSTSDSPLLRHADRRRSSVLGSRYFDPSAPGPGETQLGDGRTESPASGDLRLLGSRSGGDAGPTGRRTSVVDAPWLPVRLGAGTVRHDRERAPSLGDIHQELEQEQEAQVNRLLGMIHQQQQQLQAIQHTSQVLQQQASFDPGLTPPVVGGGSQHGLGLTLNTMQDPLPPMPPFAAGARPRSPIPRPSADRTRQNSRSSRTPSRTGSPALRPMSSGRPDRGGGGDDFYLGATAQVAASAARDDVAFYQAEATMLVRENQMLKQRVRELERQLLEFTTPTHGSPVTPSSGLAGPPLEADHSDSSAVLDSEG